MRKGVLDWCWWRPEMSETPPTAAASLVRKGDCVCVCAYKMCAWLPVLRLENSETTVHGGESPELHSGQQL